MPILKRIPTKWERYWKSNDSYDESVSYWKRLGRWVHQRRYKTPLEVEKLKFTSEPIRPFWPFGIALLTGSTFYIIWDKIYSEHRWLRESGSTMNVMTPYTYIIYWHARLKATIWMNVNISLMERAVKGVAGENPDAEFEQRKEMLMKATQIEYYKKRRIDTFDFAYLGELEDFSLSL